VKLSIVIVNYNVKHFLEQCLHSVEVAIQGIEAEVWVVDNNSVDGSMEMVAEKFPRVKTVLNTQNLGFSKANNLAIRKSTGQYVLLLNPDTVVEESTFRKVIAFMDEHPEAGGLGVKMIDGRGKFLPESKRGLPTPSVAFSKIFGLSKLFPRSKLFGAYHLGYLDPDKIHQVDVLSGAFMLLRRETLDKTGLLDEDYFMYGEDIDLSYRITKAGYKNYYFPETRIIHYKGESTKKSSVNYVLVFYNAMVIFARKHFSRGNADLFSFLIRMAIYLRAGAAIGMRLLKRISFPLVDALAGFGGIYAIKEYYEQNFKYLEGGSYPPELMRIFVPGFLALWVIAVFLSGGYDKPVRIHKIWRGILVGTGLVLVCYALLPENLRFSRILILLAAFWIFISFTLLRIIYFFAGIKGFELFSSGNNRIVIVGSQSECERVGDLLKKTMSASPFIAFVSEGEEKGKEMVGTFSQLKEVCGIFKIQEVIFCARDIPAGKIISIMADPEFGSIDYKIAPPESLSVVGSNSINSSGDLYVLDTNSISKAHNRRNKRLIDVLVSLALLLGFPLLALLIPNPGKLFSNLIKVFAGKISWVGFSAANENGTGRSLLPRIRKGILTPADQLKKAPDNPEITARLDFLYARDYRAWNDLKIILMGWQKLGR
jgi:O-antigen biosynthesis protein